MVSGCNYLRLCDDHIAMPLPCGIDVEGVRASVGAFILLLSYMAVDHIPDENLGSVFRLVFTHLGPLNEEVI